MIFNSSRVLFGIGTVAQKSLFSRRNIKMNQIERIISNNVAAEQLLESLKEELKVLKNQKAASRIEKLKIENDALRKQVEVARMKLIELEIKNGKPQIPIPGQETLYVTPVVVKEQFKQEITSSAEKYDNDSQTLKEKKQKKDKPKGDLKSVSNPVVDEPPIDVGRLDMRVGKIVEVSRHPDADSLYLEKIDCGESSPRTIISGLVKFVPVDEMQNRLVVVLCNLKPAKMRGILSEGMVMCASSAEKVEILTPPEGSVPGDLVHVEGFTRAPDSVMNPKKKIFETVAPDLHTNDQLIACYKQGAFMIPGKGVVKAQTLKNVAVK